MCPCDRNRFKAFAILKLDFVRQAKRTDFDFRVKDPMGQRFDRWLRKKLNSKEKKSYDSMSRELKAKFRAEWGKARYQEYEEGRSHVQKETHIEKTTGTFLNFDQLLREEGAVSPEAPSSDP